MVTELLKNIYRIEVPLPKSPLKLLNSYLIKGEDRSLLIDTGFNRPECKEALMSGLEELGVEFAKTDIFLTHLHADHTGLVSEIKTDDNIVYASRPDGIIINSSDSGEYWRTLYEQFRLIGLRLTYEEAIETHPGYKFKPEVPASGQLFPIEYVYDGDYIEVGEYKFRCVATPGHTPGHMCLYEEDHKILFAGDMILGDITPNLCPERFSVSSLTSFLRSLDIVEALDVEHVFVGHRNMLNDLQARIDEIRKHHKDRCEEVLEALKLGPMDAGEVAQHMSWDITAKSWEDFPPSQKWFATGEAYEHLIHLYQQAFVKRMYREDGVEYFALT